MIHIIRSGLSAAALDPILEGMAPLLLALLIGAGVPAQQKPAFAGTWIIQPPNKAAGTERVIKQGAGTISITTSGRTTTYQLDGVERREARAARGGDVVFLTKAAWVGNTVVVTVSTAYPNNMKTLEKEIWSIDSAGQWIVDFTETAEGQPPRTMKIVHKKKS